MNKPHLQWKDTFMSNDVSPFKPTDGITDFLRKMSTGA